MIGSSQLFIRWAVWLSGSAVGLYFIGQSVLLIARWLRSEKASANEPFSSAPGIATRGLLPSIAGLLARTIESRTTFLVLGLLVGTTYGWMIRSYQITANRYHYHDVLVLERHDDHNFRVQAADMQPWEMATCESVDWQPGQKMAFLDFQWHPKCDNVGESGAFEFYSYKGKRLTFPTEEVVNARGY